MPSANDQSHSHFHLSFFVPTFAGGGAERVVVTLANAFAEVGHRVDLLFTSRRDLRLASVSPQVSVVDFGRSHTWQTIPALIRTLRQRQPDVLVSALFGATVAAYTATTWMQTWGERVPSLCATVHSPLSHAEAKGMRAHLLLRAAHIALRRVETVVAVSRSVAQDLATQVGRARERTDVIHNPIDIDAVQSEARAPSPHVWFTEDVPVVVSAGRLHPQKDYGTLLRALAQLGKENRVRAIILGDGPERKRLEEQSRELGISRYITFPGFVENPYAFMKRADVFALSSASESFGNVVVEALACGTPVVATESGGPTEILKSNDATYGSLAPPDDPTALADALTSILSRSVDHRRLQRRARDFDASEAIDRYHALFERIIRDAP